MLRQNVGEEGGLVEDYIVFGGEIGVDGGEGDGDLEGGDLGNGHRKQEMAQW